MPDKLTYEELEQRVRELKKRERTLLEKSPSDAGDGSTHSVESERIAQDSIPEVDLGTIINSEEIQSIMDDFCSLTGMVTAILDLKGNVVEATGWRDICTKFHRADPKTAHNCTQSDLYLAKNLRPGDYVDYKCKNGLWDVVTPLYVGTRHLGNIYTGQFFYDDEPIDKDFFIKQAERYGFDKNAYMDAFQNIPRYSRETIQHLMSFLVKFTTYISKISLARKQLEKEVIDRKQAEKALQESEEKFRAIAETSPLAIYMSSGIEQKAEYINPRFIKLFGYTMAEVPTVDQWWPLAYPDEKYRRQIEKEWQRKVKDAIESQLEIEPMEVVVTCKDGSKKDISWGFITIGKQNWAFGLDLTERKQAESERERLMTAIDQAGEMIIITDALGTIQYTNPAFERATGYRQKEAIGQNPRILKSGQQNEAFYSTLWQTISGGQIWKGRLVNKRKDGSLFSEEASISPVFDVTGKIVHYVGVKRDITDQIRLESQVLQAQKMESISILAGGIAHDFNNLLSVITGNISYVLSITDKNDETYGALWDVQQGAKQAQNLTQQLLTFSKGGDPIKKTADLNRIVSESAQFVTRGAKSKCELHLADNLWHVAVDPGQINQVIGNLVINANQAMPNGGTICIRTENIEIETESTLSLPAGPYIKITIEDQGIGISQKHLANIFDPYFSTKQNGSGLGLATAYSIIKKHGGQIGVDSEIDIGTAFTIYLPASLTTREKTEKVKVTPHGGQGKILIMDDQEAILKMIGRMLNRMGYEAVFAMDGAQTIDLYRKTYQSGNPFDLVILDLTIPGGMGGAETIPELLKINPNVKAVVSSGYSNDPIMANYKEYGFCGVVPKPYTTSQLADLLNNIFSEKS